MKIQRTNTLKSRSKLYAVTMQKKNIEIRLNRILPLLVPPQKNEY